MELINQIKFKNWKKNGSESLMMAQLIFITIISDLNNNNNRYKQM